MKQTRTARPPRARRAAGPHSNSAAYDRFLQELAAGIIKPGERLGEPTLAARWKVSRLPVRDALIRLECEGLVERHHRSGTYVRQYDREEIEELYSLRALIEVFVIRKVAEAVTDEQLEELETLAAAADACDRSIMSVEEIIERETRFHLRLCEISNLRHALRLMNIQHLLLLTLQISAAKQPAYPITSHREIVTALRTRDAEHCAKVVQEWADWSLDDLLSPKPTA